MFRLRMRGLPPSVNAAFPIFDSIKALSSFMEDVASRGSVKCFHLFSLFFAGSVMSVMIALAVGVLGSPSFGVIVAVSLVGLVWWQSYSEFVDLACFVYRNLAGDIYYAKKLGPPTLDFPPQCYLEVERPWITFVLADEKVK